MNEQQQNLIRETFTASNEGRMHFGDVIGKLMQASVESYTVDYRSHRTVYHLLNDETLSLDMTSDRAVS